MQNFIDEFVDRGFYYQCSALEKLKELSNSQKIAGYIGFDGTAKSLHVGNMVQIMILRLLQKHGHKPIVIVGGATSKIGDPTGKDEMRKVLSDEDLNNNIAGIKKSLSKFLKFGDGDSDAIILNNNDWIKDISYLDFLTEYGRMISVNRMLSMEAVKSRIEREQQLTYLEFNYMLLQAYDFAHLYEKYGCVLQIGGSDQWGNIIMGVELVHKKHQAEVFALTTPLLTTASGAKMGKSVSGAIWLNEDMLSPYEYYQYWRNTDDRDVLRFAKLFSEFDSNEMSELEKISQGNINEAKKKLAYRLTEMCHVSEEAFKAEDMSSRIFEQGIADDNLPSIFVSEQDLNNGIPAYEMFYLAGLTESKSEARNLIKGMGAKVNDERILDEAILINSKYLLNEKVKLSAGKKRHALVKIRA